MNERRRDRGISMELALVTLLVIFGLCLTMLTVAELGAALNKRITTEAEDRVALSRIGDIFIDSCATGRYDLFIPSAYADDYAVEKAILPDGTYLMTVSSLTDGELLLRVRCDAQGRVLEFTRYQEETIESPESSEPDSSEPDSSENASSEATSSETASSEATSSETASSETASSEVASSETASSEVASSEATSSEIASSEATSSEIASSEATPSDSETP